MDFVSAEKLFSMYLLTMLVLPTEELPTSTILKTAGGELLVNSFEKRREFCTGGLIFYLSLFGLSLFSAVCMIPYPGLREISDFSMRA